MDRRMPRRVVGLAVLAFLAGMAGCKKGGAGGGETPPPDVEFVHPTLREVTEYEEFTGRTEAKDTVDLRARVTGYLNTAAFKEGSFVKEKDLLFEIDARTYKAELDRARAQLRQAEATQTRLALDYQRAQQLLGTRSISREEVDKITGNRSEADAAVAAARAALRSADLNLGFTRITAPLSGRISRRLVDPGNLVKADETILTTIVSLDPIYAYFDIDERTVLRLRRLINEGKLVRATETRLPVKLALADQKDFSSGNNEAIEGYLDFVDNRLDPGTGTLRVRTLIKNPLNAPSLRSKEKDSVHLLSPGMFLRMRLPVSLTESFPVVPEEALGSDQGQKFVYVVVEEADPDDPARVVQVVKHRRVSIGQLQGDGMRVIKKGLPEKTRARIVVAGQQKVRPGKKVNPTLRIAPDRSPPAGAPAAK